MKIFFSLVVCVFLLPLTFYATQKESEDNVCLHEEALRKAADKYLDCIHQISKGIDFYPTETTQIISENCKKILNGQLFTQNREDFLRDLCSVYENLGSWEVSPADIIIAPSSNTVVLRLLIEMEKIGTYTAIAILHFDSEYLVTEINEVLNEAKGSYDFKDHQ